MRKPMTPGQRKKRIVRDALVLLACLALLVVVRDFPIPTAELALAATQEQELFGPGEIITVLDYVNHAGYSGEYDRYYILRDGDFYAWCGVDHDGILAWRAGSLAAVENDPSVPLVPLVIHSWPDGAVLVIANDPEIAEVEVLYLYNDHSSGLWELASARETEQTENCYIVRFRVSEPVLFRQDILVRGYNAAGEMIYQSPIPEVLESYGIIVGTDGTVEYEPLVPDWWEDIVGVGVPDTRGQGN